MILFWEWEHSGYTRLGPSHWIFLNLKRNSENVASPGLLQPLPILENVLADISIEFCGGITYIIQLEVIMLIDDHISKGAHFIPAFSSIFSIHNCPTLSR